MTVVPIRRPVAAQDQVLAVERSAIEVGDFFWVGGIGEVEHREAALVPGLHHDVAAGHRNQRAVMRHAVLLLTLRRRHLVVATEYQLLATPRRRVRVAGGRLINDVEDRIRAPRERIRRAAPRPAAAAPFIREDDLGAVVVERRRVPVGKALVGNEVEAFGISRIADVHQDAVAGARPRGETDLRIYGDVVALRRHAGGLRAGAVIAALPQAPQRARRFVHEDARLVDDARVLRRCQRHLDHVDAEERGVWIVLFARAALQLLAGSHRTGAGVINIDPALVLQIGYERVRVRAAARLHGGHLPWLGDIGDVEDPHAAEPLGAHRRLHALQTAVEAAAGLLRRHEQQVAPDRHVALAAGTDHRGDQPWP